MNRMLEFLAEQTVAIEFLGVAQAHIASCTWGSCQAWLDMPVYPALGKDRPTPRRLLSQGRQRELAEYLCKAVGSIYTPDTVRVRL